ncbi:MAG: tetratricopeptide repeat protein, partial [Bacteroidota bacterium]
MKKFIFLFLLFALSISVSAQLPPDTLALLDEYVEVADAAYEQKDYKQAAVYYEKSLKIDSNSNGLARLTAESYAQANNPEKAIEYLKYFIEVQKNYGFTSFSEDIEENELLHPIKDLEAFKELVKDLKVFEADEAEKERQYAIQLKKQQKQLETALPHRDFLKKLEALDASKVYEAIQNYNDFPKLEPIEDQCLFFWYQLNDTLELP